ncbi:hypothetical protein RFI_26042 [Reticulomyxa filosa]|uniref:Uncharacterized protein n=1 Tax=Reticulomyxa filosa TaxID=46433 RepID=X6ME73_RETFI|nr:hypothetical protein RFI_26042 [Reticulomyxa filosa]|eukprot:ETO11335.1 hypothetical protein RFI_26042 [Reticulomyxa filosa]
MLFECISLYDLFCDHADGGHIQAFFANAISMLVYCFFLKFLKYSLQAQTYVKEKKKMLRINGHGDTSTVIESVWGVIEDEISRQSKHLGYSMSTIARQLREINKSDKEKVVSFVLSNSRDKFCACIGFCELTKQIPIEGQWLMWDTILQKVVSMDLSKIISPSQFRTLSFHNSVHRDNNKNSVETSMPMQAKEEKKTPEDEIKKQRQMKTLLSLFVSGFQCLIKKASDEHEEHEDGTNSEKIALKTTKYLLLEKNWPSMNKDCICNEKGRTYHVQLKPPANHSLKPFLSTTQTASPFSNANNIREKDDIFICV